MSEKPSLLFYKVLIVIFLTSITTLTVYLSAQLHKNSEEDKKLKLDYFNVNQIKYGLLSGDKWSLQVNKIIATQIDSFSLSGENKKLLTDKVNTVLYKLLDEVEGVLHKEQKSTKDRIKFKVINAFVDVDKFRSEVPKFSNSIIKELDKTKNRSELKLLLKEKVTGILIAASQDSCGEQSMILKRYGCVDTGPFNTMVAKKTTEINQEQRTLSYILIAALVSVLLMWILVIRLKVLYAFTFLYSVVISFLALYIGISLPMIEIDARIATLDLKLLSSHILFHEQVIFFQTKSILDVIHILIKNGKADSVFVGVLIFMFSVIFPVTKLISTTVYLFIKEKSNRFIRYMAFNSGKWSMADVMVVAIFMAFVGFQNILDDQLEDITVKNDTINLITTNRTNLQAGYLIFVTFCLFNLVLAEILKRITRKTQNAGV